MTEEELKQIEARVRRVVAAPEVTPILPYRIAIEDAPALIAEVRRLRSMHSPDIECIHCGEQTPPNSDWSNHWQQCVIHPARQEVHRLQAENDRLRQENDRQRQEVER